MHNEPHKNWNNFFLGLIVAVLPWLGLPMGLKAVVLTILGFLIALFSLARLQAPAPATPTNDQTPQV